MSNKITIGLSPLTATIFAGRVNKAETMWVGEKYDVTDQCTLAVAGLLQNKQIIYERGGKTFELKEVEIDKSQQ